MFLDDADKEIIALRSQIDFSTEFIDKLMATNDKVVSNLRLLTKVRDELMNQNTQTEVLKIIQLVVDNFTVALEPLEPLNSVIRNLSAKNKSLESKISAVNNERNQLSKEFKDKMKRLEHDLDNEKIHSNSLEKRLESVINNIASVEFDKEEANRRILEKESLIKELNDALDSSRKALYQVRSEQHNLTSLIAKQEEELSELYALNNEISNEKNSIESNLMIMKENYVEVQRSLQDKMDLYRKMSFDLASTLEQKEALEANYKQVESELIELREVLSSKDEEKNLLMTTYCRLIQDNEKLSQALKYLQSEYESCKEELSSREEILAKTRQENERESSLFETLRKELEEKQEGLRKIKATLDENDRKIAVLEIENKDLKGQLESLNEKCSRNEKARAELNGQLSQKNLLVAELQTKLEHFDSSKKAAVREEVSKKEGEISLFKSQLERKIESLELDLKQKSLEIIALNERNKALTSELEEKAVSLRKESEYERQKKGDFEKRLDECHSKLRNYEAQLDSMTKEKIDLEQKSNDMKNDYKRKLDEVYDQLKSSTETKMEMEKSLKEKIRDLENQLESLKNQISMLHSENHNLQAIVESLNSIMKDSPVSAENPNISKYLNETNNSFYGKTLDSPFKNLSSTLKEKNMQRLNLLKSTPASAARLNASDFISTPSMQDKFEKKIMKEIYSAKNQIKNYEEQAKLLNQDFGAGKENQLNNSKFKEIEQKNELLTRLMDQIKYDLNRATSISDSPSSEGSRF